MIPKHKIVDCSRCHAEGVPGRKRGIEYICLECCKRDDVLKQMEKAKKKHALKGDAGKIKALGIKQDVSLEQKALNASKAAAMRRWFDERRGEMTGKCRHCGGKTLKHNDKMFYYCIAHILPKAYFKSVATHHDNWIELCFYGNSCHTNLDNHAIDLMELNCFDEVVAKFVRMYPDIDPDEKRRIPSVLLQYVEIEK